MCGLRKVARASAEGAEGVTNPLVCAVLLTNGRPELARKAIECFWAQTYQNKIMVIVFRRSGDLHGCFPNVESAIGLTAMQCAMNLTIGELRNMAAKEVCRMKFPPDILMHWDDDDWSHPKRMEEQVSLLQVGAEVVGYSDLLFWREAMVAGTCHCTLSEMPQCAVCGGLGKIVEPGEAWLFKAAAGNALGTSLAYWRAVWERQHFKATSYGEDTEWLAKVQHELKLRLRTIPSTKQPLNWMDAGDESSTGFESRGYFNLIDTPEPRMIARIHGRNTSTAYDRQAMLDAPNHWRRVPEWDAHLREVMEP